MGHNGTTPTTLPPQATQAPSPDFAALSGQYNIQPTYYGGTEQQVYLGHTAMQGSADHPIAPATDEVVPISHANGVIYGWGRDELERFQDGIIRAGLVTAREIVRGARDANTVTVWQHLVGQSADAYDAGERVAPLDLLSELQAQGGTDPNAKRQPFVAEVANSDDLRHVFREVAQKVLGRGVDVEPHLDAMVAAFQGKQVAAQRAEYDGTNPGAAGGVVAAAPDPQTFAEMEAHRIDPTAYDSQKVLDKFAVIHAMLSGQGVPSGNG